MFNSGILNFFSTVRNPQRLVKPVETSISPIIDIAMKVNKVKQDDLQPLEALNKRMSRAFKMINRLEKNRHRAEVALRLEIMELLEDRRLLIELRNDPPVSIGTQTYFVKKPCRVRFEIPGVTWEEDTINEIWQYPKMIISFITKMWVIVKFIVKHLKNPVMLHNMAAKIYVGFEKIIHITTKIDIPNNETTINFRLFPRNST
ncbi:uncharacterized protein LOC114129474 [Aphis gossypii]|uniref:uncharacterized protein LOC114129474 n=1 Tax=Aphis gossypii TaxID=80765 RepID=UPI002158C2C6|nr:uncharacterized protein LOC114129474 [Aphis gossypii]XP_050063689.1 uncharacterized protein LOC114129474 [Aphis gossypii]